MWTLLHFLLEPGYDDYLFLDQAVEKFKHGVDSITDSVNTPKHDCIFDSLILLLLQSIWVLFVCLASTLSGSFKLLLASNIKSNKFWCKGSVLLLPVSFIGIISATKLIPISPVIVWHLDSRPLFNWMMFCWILLLGILIKSLSDFQPGIDACAYAALDTGQLFVQELQLWIVMPPCRIVMGRLR